MKNSNIEKPTLLASFLGSIIMILDGLSMVFFGLIYLVGAANADFFYDMGKKEVVLHLGQIVAVLTLVYLILCIVSLVFWQKGRLLWKYVVLSLGLLHLAVSSYLMFSPDWESDLARLYFYSSIALNLVLVAITIFGRRKVESLAKDSNA